jgi:glycopeptide antibiotics resistance protein
MKWITLVLCIGWFILYIISWVHPATVKDIALINTNGNLALFIIFGHMTFDHWNDKKDKL